MAYHHVQCSDGALCREGGSGSGMCSTSKVCEMPYRCHVLGILANQRTLACWTDGRPLHPNANSEDFENGSTDTVPMTTCLSRQTTSDDSTSPLLAPAIAPSRPSALHTRMAMPLRTRKHRVWPSILLLILVYLSAVLYTLPLNRVIELRLCQTHYSLHDPSSIALDGSIPEALCKIDEVQRQLAWLQGIMETTMVVCGT
jgi:hypothetical protein